MAETLTEARERVEASDGQRKQLLADVSHELATPLTSIRGYAETLLDPEVPVSAEERAAYLSNILGESERLDLLIRELFDLTRLEAGGTALRLERIDWNALCRHTADRLRKRFEDAGLTLRLENSNRPAWILADGRRIEQVLENLLTNAVRYVPAGGSVELRLDEIPGNLTVDHQTPPVSYRLEVADTGPGIPAEHIEHIFDRFHRANAAQHVGGSGLGLAIVREIVRRHEGQVTAANREPSGSLFSVTLPADHSQIPKI
jgi:signal transduction histidine kinase